MLCVLLPLPTASEVRADDAEQQGAVPLQPGIKQLFLDDYVVEHARGVSKTLHQPRKYLGNPVIKPEHEWEISHIQLRTAPLWNPEKDRWEMRYFGASPVFAKLKYSCGSVCLAVSRDGLKWEKPMPGPYEFKGAKQNNLAHEVCNGPGLLMHVLYDPCDPDPKRR